MIWKWLLSLWVLLLASCQSLVPISQRHMSEVPEATGKSKTPTEPEIFVRRQKIEIEPVEINNPTGSLFNARDQRNNLFGDHRRGDLDTHLDIDVTSSRLDQTTAAPAATNAPAAAAADNQAAADGDLEDTLLKALPDLDAGEHNPTLIKRFKMRVSRRLPNGDLMAVYQRSSINDQEANAVFVRARIPYQAVESRRPLTTADLADVEWNETKDGETITRLSHGWEDEYTLRMSGFSEAKSKLALQIEDKRKQVEKIRQELQTRINTFGNERRRFAQEREELRKARQELDDKVKALEEKIRSQEQMIQDQSTRLNEAQPPPARPGDEQEGARGA